MATIKDVPRPRTGETKVRKVRVPDGRWERLDAAAGALRSDRSKLINQLLAWYLGEPGAELPGRPAQDDAPKTT